MVLPLFRRALLTAAPAAPFLRVDQAPAQPADPRQSAEGQIKLTATLDGTPAYWVYNGIIYAVRPATHPLPLLAITGCNSIWADPMQAGAWRVSGALLTFFRDPDSGAFLDDFTNPITGETCQTKPNYLHGGSMIYPADGSSAAAEGQISASVIAPKGFGPSDPAKKLGAVRWSQLGATIMLTTDRSWNAAAQPQLEAQTQSGDASTFFNPAIRRMDATVATTTITPWITWLNMAGRPGHLVWHVTGAKLFDAASIPADYRARAGALLPKLLARP